MKIIVSRKTRKFITINCEHVVVTRSDDRIEIRCSEPGEGTIETSVHVKVVKGKSYTYRGVSVVLSPGIYTVERSEGKVVLTRAY